MIYIEKGNNPLAFFLLALAVLSGVSGLIDPVATSPLIARILARWELYVWYGGLAVSSGIALVGLLLRELLSLRVELTGLVILTPFALFYVIALVTQAGPSQGLLIVLGFLGACVARVYKILRELRRAEKRRIQKEARGG